MLHNLPSNEYEIDVDQEAPHNLRITHTQTKQMLTLSVEQAAQLVKTMLHNQEELQLVKYGESD